MCLRISQKQRQPGCTNKFVPVVRKAPYVAYKAVCNFGDNFFTPYQDVQVKVGVVYKASMRPLFNKVHKGLHMCLTSDRALAHAGTVLVALVPPGAEVYYDDFNDEIAVSEAVYFRTKADAEFWWKDNWHKYKDKM